MASVSPEPIVNIVELLYRAQVRVAEDLPALFAHALMVQEARTPGRLFVSRTSILYAALGRDKELAEILEQSGFDAEQFRRSIDSGSRLPSLDLTSLRPLPDGIAVEGDLMAMAVMRYAARFPGRPIDTRGLIFGILSEPDGGLLKGRLLSAGLDLKAVPEILANRIPLGWRDLRPFESLESFSLSANAIKVLNSARRLAKEHRAPVTSSLLLVALCEEGDRMSAESAGVVSEALTNPDRKRYNEVSAGYHARALQPRLEEASGDRITARVHGLIAQAQDISVRTTGGTRIHVRHLIGALVTPLPAQPGSAAWELIRLLGREPQDLAAALLRFLLAVAPQGDDLAAWHSILGGAAPAAAAVAGSAPMPPFDSDDLLDSDLLDIGPSVRAFASLFASQELVPPLSVGLFGDWGSGKSFFLRQLRHRVDNLAKAARGRRRRGQPTVLLSDIVQVEFNAWHYAEVNLWAGLVTHIFDTLNRHFSPQQEQKDRWEALIRRLDEASRLQADSQGMLRQAEDNLAATQERLRQSRLGLGNAIETLWSSLDEDSKRDVADVAGGLGLDGIEEIKEDLVQRRAEARQLGERIALYQQAAVRGLGSLAFFKTYALVLLLVGAIALVLLLVSGFAGTFAAALRSFVNVAAAAAAVLGGVAAWIGSALQKGSKVVAALQRVESTVRRKLQVSREGDAVRAAQQAVQIAGDEVEERRRKVSEVRSQVDNQRPSRWLSDFLRERAASSDYHKYLGLTAIVRRDFEKLHQLMTQAPLAAVVAASAVVVKQVDGVEELDLQALALALNEALAGQDLPLAAERCRMDGSDDRAWYVLDPDNARRIEVPRQDDEKQRQRGEAPHPGDEAPRHDAGCRTCRLSYDGPRIDRIVLYIDDLDRCPPARVVEVLEAVHLLLALPLFVVVVGVDLRWVTRALELQYRDLWRRSPGLRAAGGRNPDEMAATPQDYLEKIFQVPFWLRPLDSALSGKLLNGLLRRRSQDLQGSGARQGGATPAATQPGGSADAALDAVAQVDADARTTGAAIVLPAGPPGASAAVAPEPFRDAHRAAPGETISADSGTAIAGEIADLDADASAGRLVLDNREIELLTSLGRLVGRSPRAVKRFVNTYRLIRAAVPAADIMAFLGTPEDPGRDRLVLVLLGIAIGAPQLAAELERQIAALPREQAIRDFPDWNRIAPELAEAAALPRNAWTVDDLRRELARVNQYSFRSARS